MYGYALGDPVNLSDPFGLCPICIELGIAFFEALEWAALDAMIAIEAAEIGATTLALARGLAAAGEEMEDRELAVASWLRENGFDAVRQVLSNGAVTYTGRAQVYLGRGVSIIRQAGRAIATVHYR